jgi:hypothetical protein
MRVRALLLISILMLGACTRQPDATLPSAWARTDGQPVNSGLLEIAGLDCRDEMQSADGASRGPVDKVVGDFVSCMREHGYVASKS